MNQILALNDPEGVLPLNKPNKTMYIFMICIKNVVNKFLFKICWFDQANFYFSFVACLFERKKILNIPAKTFLPVDRIY